MHQQAWCCGTEFDLWTGWIMFYPWVPQSPWLATYSQDQAPYWVHLNIKEICNCLGQWWAHSHWHFDAIIFQLEHTAAAVAIGTGEPANVGFILIAQECPANNHQMSCLHRCFLLCSACVIASINLSTTYNTTRNAWCTKCFSIATKDLLISWKKYVQPAKVLENA